MNTHPESSITIARMEMFSDAIFAIIMTLLVLELKVPQLIENATIMDQLWALGDLMPKFISFATTFLVIAIFWVNHHSFLNSIHKADSKLLWLNNLLLFWICFIPFPTAWIGEHIHSTVPVALYGFTLCMSAFSFQLAVRHAHHSGLFKEHISKPEQERRSRRSYPGIFLYFISIPLAFINPYFAIAIFIATPLLYFIPD